jgi:lipopolysaccharide transport system ATP-binding protein
MSDIVIRAEGLGKRYRRGVIGPPETLRDLLTRVARSPLAAMRKPSQEFFWALSDVGIEVRHGEVLGLIGRNGAGKTTLLKILSRITRPTTGWAEIHGRVRSLLEVGTGFHGELSGRENTYLSGSILGMSKREIDRKFDEIVAFAEVDKFIDTPVKHYSSGMYVRLAFAVAAHLEPEILLVDEVLAVGDASFQKKCLGKMGDVAKAGRTIIFVSHNLTALRRLSTRAMWLAGGKTVEIGDSGVVIDNYLRKTAVSSLESQWPDEATAPGDERVRLRSVKLIPEGDPADPITVHTPLRVEFTYWNYVPGMTLSLSIHIYNLEEVCIFVTVSDFAPRPVGLIRQTVEIPRDILNTGSYYINFFLVKDSSVAILSQSSVVAFEVVEGEVIGNWYGRMPGAVRPKLKWKSEIIEAAAPEVKAYETSKSSDSIRSRGAI